MWSSAAWATWAIGWRKSLADLGLDVVVVSLNPRERFADPLRARAAVLSGDISLPQTLERASICFRRRVFGLHQQMISPISRLACTRAA